MTDEKIVTSELTEGEYKLIGDLIAYAHVMGFFDQGCLSKENEDEAREIAELELRQPIFTSLAEKFGVDLSEESEEVKTDA